MSGYQTFAVAGAGDIGRFIIQELLNHVSDGSVETVVALTRTSSGYDELKEQGAVFKTVDYSSHSNLVAALQGIDVVISSLSGPALSVQIPLADAAKEAGVKHFVPCEYGNPSGGKTYGIFGIKNRVRLHLLDIGLPYSQYYTGPWSDWFFNGDHAEFGFDIPNGKTILRGSGNVPISWTARVDVARYIVYVLTHLSPTELKSKPFAIEGERSTINQIIEEYEARSGKKLEITYESTEFLEKQVKEHPDDFENGFIRMLFLEWERGEGTTGTSEDVNKYWPEFNPRKVVDIILSP
ncbi:NAD-binding protein [Calocera viscosa TUFC12733]|uniref:NAD-binding protein n=1 Tax=Calocera viscosa (strain TUFC12733) TaxID=1330018 RepID=A0A167KGX7_CALVF|nr:NAD-binding protein [Calocera viscosa TUFC12733]